MPEYMQVELHSIAMDAAVEAATDAFAAGEEEYGQLEAGIKAYLWTVAEKQL